jgi:hypothetical protein
MFASFFSVLSESLTTPISGMLSDANATCDLQAAATTSLS